MKKKNLAVVLGSTDNYFFATGTVVLNLLKFSPNLADDIIIYYDKVAPRDREILEGELGCKLVPYELPFTIGLDASQGFANFTPLSLSIYEIFKLLGGYHNVLWLDSDVCIQQDISGILDIHGDACIRHGGAIFSSAMGCAVHPEIDNLPTNNTGVVLVRDSLPEYNDLCEQCYHYTQRFIKTLAMPDQAILNYVLWKNKIPIADLGRHYNYTVHHDLHSYNRAAIFHIANFYKFWNHSILRNLFPIWRECHQKWLDLGGSAYTGDQKYPDVGNHLSLLKVLTGLDENNMRAFGRELVIEEQANTIRKLEGHLSELMDLLKAQPGALCSSPKKLKLL